MEESGLKSEFEPLVVPQEIVQRSFATIAEEFGAHGYSEPEWAIVQRVIHATADFDLGRSLVFHPGAIAAGIEALQRGEPIVTDVQMVKAGLNASLLNRLGVDSCCFIGDEDVRREAERQRVTRAMAAMRKAAAEVSIGGIFVVGNAPTALLELVRLMETGRLRPSLVVGIPVGFVSVAESKQELMQFAAVPFISNRGRKGGSPTAAAIVNALGELASSCG